MATSQTSSKSGARRRARPPGPKRLSRQAEVTEAACEIFWEKGYRAASLQDVADRFGVLKGSLYYYIESKEDLLWRIVEDMHLEAIEILDEALALDVSPIERIRVYIDRHVEWYLSNIQAVTVFFREWRNLTDERLRTEKDRRRGYEQVIRDLIASAQEAGQVSPELDLQYAALYVLAAVNAVPDWYRPNRGDSPGRVAQVYAEMTVGMLTGTRSAGSD